MPRVKPQVLDSHGRVVQEARTAVDGGVWSREVPLGRYSVRAEPELVRRGRLLAGGGPGVTLVPVPRCAVCDAIVSGGTGPLKPRREPLGLPARIARLGWVFGGVPRTQKL